MAQDIFDATGGGDGVIKHGNIIMNYAVPSGLNRFESNEDAVFNTPIMAEISGKFSERFDDPTYY